MMHPKTHKHLDYIILKDSDITATINPSNGQLISLFIGRELIHPGGRFEDDPKRNVDGWSNSGLIMFPIVGASKDNSIIYDGKSYPLDQHGILRSMTPVCNAEKKHCIVQYIYTKNTRIKNIKYCNDKIHPEYLALPFSFEVSEKYLINKKERRLEITTSIKNNSDKQFSYALGRHPAFIAIKDMMIYIDEMEKLDMQQLMHESKTGIGAYIVRGATNVLACNKQLGVKLWTDFGSIMLWSPKENMFCIEPITDRKENDVILDLSSKGSYDKILRPKETKKYHTYIMAIKNT
jgi:hypothetical protein